MEPTRRATSLFTSHPLTKPSDPITQLPALDELMELFPRVIKGMGRHVEHSLPATGDEPIGPRHCAALRRLMAGPITVGTLAGHMEITLPTASGLLATLDRAGLIIRSADPADRRRTIVDIRAERRAEVGAWLTDLAEPLTAALAQLDDDEIAGFVKAMRLFAGAVSPDDRSVPAECVAQAQD